MDTLLVPGAVDVRDDGPAALKTAALTGIADLFARVAPTVDSLPA